MNIIPSQILKKIYLFIEYDQVTLLLKYSLFDHALVRSITNIIIETRPLGNY